MLGFSLWTHKHFFQGAEEHAEERGRAMVARQGHSILLIATAVVALLSEFLVGTIENVRDSVGLTEVFVGVIVVAIVGNAAEHSTAILMAMKNKMDLERRDRDRLQSANRAFCRAGADFSLLPFRATDGPGIHDAGSGRGRGSSVYILFQISGDGETNWIEGIQLLSVYVILGILFFYLPEPQQTAHTQLSRDLTCHADLPSRALAVFQCSLPNEITNYGA